MTTGQCARGAVAHSSARVIDQLRPVQLRSRGVVNLTFAGMDGQRGIVAVLKVAGAWGGQY